MPPDGVVQRQPVERAGVLGGEIRRRRVAKPPANRSFLDTPSSRRPRCMRNRVPRCCGRVISGRERGKEMRGQRWVWLLFVVLLGGAVGRLHAEDIGCVSTTFRVLVLQRGFEMWCNAAPEP